MRVKKVDYLEDYKLKILFGDNKTKIVDMKTLITESKSIYFIPLKDIEYFKKVKLDDEQYPLSICWPNDADVCPDVLYEMGQDVENVRSKFGRKHKNVIRPLSKKTRRHIFP